MSFAMSYDVSSLVGQNVTLHTESKVHTGKLLNIDADFIVIQNKVPLVFPVSSVVYFHPEETSERPTAMSFTEEQVGSLVTGPKK